MNYVEQRRLKTMKITDDRGRCCDNFPLIVTAALIVNALNSSSPTKSSRRFAMADELYDRLSESSETRQSRVSQVNRVFESRHLNDTVVKGRHQ